MLSLQTYKPKKLARFVKSFWFMQVDEKARSSYTEAIVPDGHHEIIFHNRVGNARRSLGHSNWITEPQSFIAGQTLRSYDLDLKSGSILYGIRFYPHTFTVLFGLPASLTTNRILTLDELPLAKHLADCIDPHPDKTFSNFEKCLSKFCAAADTHANKFDLIEECVTKIINQNGNLKVDALLKNAAMSHKHFDRLFLQTVGVTPKTLCNILRLNFIISLRQRDPEKTLMDYCYEAGFFDQAHMVKFFRSFTNQSPTCFFKNANLINTHFSEI